MGTGGILMLQFLLLPSIRAFSTVAPNVDQDTRAIGGGVAGGDVGMVIPFPDR